MKTRLLALVPLAGIAFSPLGAAPVAAAEDGLACANPAVGQISASFGERVNPVTGEKVLHDGTDIASKKGTKVVAAMDGVVTLVPGNAAYGKHYFYLTHANGTRTHYTHLTSKSVTDGAEVTAGQRVGKMGSLGNATGPHLHFMLETSKVVKGSTKWTKVDPEAWMVDNCGVTLGEG